jgi:hypothetical protein
MNYTRPLLVGYWQQAIVDNTFVTYKHHPTGVATLHAARSVLTQDMVANLSGFFGSGQYSVAHYTNTAFPITPDYFVVVPKDNTFSVPGSGILPASPQVLWPCDRLVIVSGQQQGWHIYAELSSNIKLAQAIGILNFNQTF